MFYLPEKEVIAKAKKGDKEAFKKLFEKHHGKILSYIYRYVGDYQKAEDITIETFLDVYRRLPDYTEEGKFLSWVYKIAVNFAKKKFRKKKTTEVSLDQPVDDKGKIDLGGLLSDGKLRPDYEAVKSELAGLIEECIAKLDKKYKNVLLLCDVQGISHDAAARTLKCSKTAVSTRLERARRLLYDTLQKKGYAFSRVKKNA